MSGIRFYPGHELVRLRIHNEPIRFCTNTTIASSPRILHTAKHVQVTLPPDVREWIATVEREFREANPGREFFDLGDRIELKINTKTRFFDDDVPCATTAAVPGRHARVDVEWLGISTRYDRCRHLFVAHAVLLQGS